jgi:hypothetical protein
MASFATMGAAETRCRAQIAANVWVHAHSQRDKTGVISVRFQRYMSPSAPGEGAWVETQDDSVN